jgi:hypothetical protein
MRIGIVSPEFRSRQLGRYWSRRGERRTAEAATDHNKRVGQAEGIFWEGGDDDPIQPRIENAVTQMEKTGRDIINSKGTLFAIINRRIGKGRG